MKKASLNMSISTIVTLILAMTLLGFGLMFIRGTFLKGFQQFETADAEVERTLKERLTSGSERLVLMTDRFEIKRGESKRSDFGLRNDLGKDAVFYFKGGNLSDEGAYTPEIVNGQNDYRSGIIQCYSSDSDTPNNAKIAITFTSPEKILLKEGEAKTYRWTVTVKSNAKPSAIYYCSFVVDTNETDTHPYARVDFVVEVK